MLWVVGDTATRTTHRKRTTPSERVQYVVQHLSDQSGSGRGLVLPVRLQNTLGLVVTRESVDTGLDENQTELRVSVSSVALHMTSDVDGLLDQVVKILRETRSKTYKREEKTIDNQ